jgi:SAM-dependent methyltransferase
MDNRKGKNLITFRTQGEESCEMLTNGILSPNEWATDESLKRIYDTSWEMRYDHEANLISNIISNFNYKKIIELGPGPGLLCNKILKTYPELEYHLVDIQAAKEANIKENLGGIFHVQDLNLDFDVSNISQNMDLFIANDFLEHIQNPARIVLKAKSILHSEGRALISVPNWRMGHAWIYRGLFDWNNFIHFMWQHGFLIEGYESSPLKTSYSPKLESESSMPDEMIQSWNFYMLFKRNDNE